MSCLHYYKVTYLTLIYPENQSLEVSTSNILIVLLTWHVQHSFMVRIFHKTIIKSSGWD